MKITTKKKCFHTCIYVNPVLMANDFFSSRLGYGLSRRRTNQSFSIRFISGVNSLFCGRCISPGGHARLN